MGLDVRIPIGLMFSVVGVLLSAYGLATLGAPGTAPTGVPIDLTWGVVMLGFGVVMLLLSRHSGDSGDSGHGGHSGP
jgi:hypothetical protein